MFGSGTIKEVATLLGIDAASNLERTKVFARFVRRLLDYVERVLDFASQKKQLTEAEFQEANVFINCGKRLFEGKENKFVGRIRDLMQILYDTSPTEKRFEDAHNELKQAIGPLRGLHAYFCTVTAVDTTPVFGTNKSTGTAQPSSPRLESKGYM